MHGECIELRERVLHIKGLFVQRHDLCNNRIEGEIRLINEIRSSYQRYSQFVSVQECQNSL